jgi:hypothetical protein
MGGWDVAEKQHARFRNTKEVPFAAATTTSKRYYERCCGISGVLAGQSSLGMWLVVVFSIDNELSATHCTVIHSFDAFFR